MSPYQWLSSLDPRVRMEYEVMLSALRRGVTLRKFAIQKDIPYRTLQDRLAKLKDILIPPEKPRTIFMLLEYAAKIGLHSHE